MQQESKASFAIVRYNLRTYEPGGVVVVIRGRSRAEGMVEQLKSGQVREDRYQGWSYFVERTTLRPGMDPRKATSLRQTRLDVREAKAQLRLETQQRESVDSRVALPGARRELTAVEGGGRFVQERQLRK